MVRPKTEEEIALLRENAIIVSKTLAEVGKTVAPGVTTKELNRVAETFIRDNGAIPSFLGFEGLEAGYMIIFCYCAVAYLIAWCCMKSLVPRYKKVELK